MFVLRNRVENHNITLLTVFRCANKYIDDHQKALDHLINRVKQHKQVQIFKTTKQNNTDAFD